MVGDGRVVVVDRWAGAVVVDVATDLAGAFEGVTAVAATAALVGGEGSTVVDGAGVVVSAAAVASSAVVADDGWSVGADGTGAGVSVRTRSTLRLDSRPGPAIIRPARPPTTMAPTTCIHRAFRRALAG